MKRTILLTVLFSVVFYACDKNKNNPSDISMYSGYLYKLSDSTPYANTSFIMYQKESGNLGNGYKPKEELVPFTTNDEGHFSVEFNSVSSHATIYICWPDAYNCGERGTTPAFNLSVRDVGILYMP